MLAQVGEAFGRLDALVNNAGTTARWTARDLDTLDMAEWDRVFAVNVRGLFQVTRAAMPWLRLGEAPAVVNTASIVGLRPGPQPPPYSASKAGGRQSHQDAGLEPRSGRSASMRSRRAGWKATGCSACSATSTRR
jgi:NAD(P)-dependent dehydrogenase (short-subunit alcohol dehydrogenase family)